MARQTKKSIKTKEEDEIVVEETEKIEEQDETVLEETEKIEEEDLKENKTLELNCLESLAYEGMKWIFVGGFMIGDLLGFYKKEDDK